MKRRWLGPARGYEVASDSVYRNKNRRSAHQRPSAHSCTGVGALGLLSAGVHSQMAARYSPAMDRWRPSRRVVTSPRLPAPAQQVASTWNSAQPGLVCRRPTCSRQSRSRGLFSICHRADAATHSEPAPRRVGWRGSGAPVGPHPAASGVEGGFERAACLHAPQRLRPVSAGHCAIKGPAPSRNARTPPQRGTIKIAHAEFRDSATPSIVNPYPSLKFRIPLFPLRRVPRLDVLRG
jgi:hypothetical protein